MKGLIQHTECCLREPGMEHFAVFFTTTRAARRGLPCITVLLAGIVPFRGSDQNATASYYRTMHHSSGVELHCDFKLKVKSKLYARLRTAVSKHN
jgi:hypothetical protein